jgi:Flp pilus assembly pilin Flp
LVGKTEIYPVGTECADNSGGVVCNGSGSQDSSERNMHQMLTTVTKRLANLKHLLSEADGSVFVEYLLLLTLVGLGVIVGLAAVRTALIKELVDLANAIAAITP